MWNDLLRVVRRRTPPPAGQPETIPSRRDSTIAIIAAPPLTVGPVLGRPSVLPWSSGQQAVRATGDQVGRLIANPSPDQLRQLAGPPARTPNSTGSMARPQPPVPAIARPRPPLTQASEQYLGTPYAGEPHQATENPAGHWPDHRPADPEPTTGIFEPANPSDLSSWISQPGRQHPEQSFTPSTADQQSFAPPAADQQSFGLPADDQRSLWQMTDQTPAIAPIPEPSPVPEVQEDQDWYPEFKQRYLEMKARGELKQPATPTPEPTVERDRIVQASIVRRTLAGTRRLGLGAPLVDGTDPVEAELPSTAAAENPEILAQETQSPAVPPQEPSRPAVEPDPVAHERSHSASPSGSTDPDNAPRGPVVPDADADADADAESPVWITESAAPESEDALSAAEDAAPITANAAPENAAPERPGHPAEPPVRQPTPPGEPTPVPPTRLAGRHPEPVAEAARELVPGAWPGPTPEPVMQLGRADEPAPDQQLVADAPAVTNSQRWSEPILSTGPGTADLPIGTKPDTANLLAGTGPAPSSDDSTAPGSRLRPVPAEQVLPTTPGNPAGPLTPAIGYPPGVLPPLAPSVGERSRSGRATNPSAAHPTVRYDPRPSGEGGHEQPAGTRGQPSYRGMPQQWEPGAVGLPAPSPAPVATLHRLPPQVATGLSTVLSADVTATRIVRGPWVNDTARSMKARAFTQQGTVFLPDDAGPLDSGVARSLLAHELTHILQAQEHDHVPESGVHADDLEQQALAAESAILGDGAATTFSWRHPALTEDGTAFDQLPAAEPARTRRAAIDLALPAVPITAAPLTATPLMFSPSAPPPVTAEPVAGTPDSPWVRPAPDDTDPLELIEQAEQTSPSDYRTGLAELAERLDELDLALRDKLTVAGDQDEAALARRLYGHLHGRLRAEFVLERERAGRSIRF